MSERDERRAKFRRRVADGETGSMHLSLADIIRTGGISNAGLQSVLSKIRESPEVLDATREDIGAAYHAKFSTVATVIRLDLKEGGTRPLDLCEPGLLVTKLLAERPAVMEEYAAAMRRWPPTSCNPWHLLVAWDEYTPGNKQRLDNARKQMVLSFTFLQLGTANLRRARMWFTPLVLRTTCIGEITGGWSSILRRYLELQLLSPNGLATAGVPVVINRQPCLIFAKLTNLLSDGDGLRSGYEWRGARSLKPCLTHYNVCKKNSDLAERVAEGHVEITCSSPELFKKQTSADIDVMVATMLDAQIRNAAGTLSNKRLKLLVQSMSYNFSAGGLLASRPLRTHCKLLECSTFDWMHTMLQKGVTTIEFQAFLGACQRKLDIGNRELEAFLRQPWEYPAMYRRKNNQLWRLIANREEHGDELRAASSELLALYGLMRFWIETTCTSPAIRQERESVIAACDLLDVLLVIKRNGVVQPNDGSLVRNAITKHLTKHKAIYGTRHLLPKHHWLYDIADQLDRDMVLLDCFVVERLHLRVKPMAEPVKFLEGSERSILAGVLNSHWTSVETSIGDGLRGKVVHDGNADFSHKLEVQDVEISAGDIVFRCSTAGRVRVAAMEGDALFLVVETMEIASEVLCVVFNV